MTEGYSHKAAHIVEHIILAIALIWAGGCTLIWMQTDMSHRIVNAKSADGTCEVTISELGSPMFFGPSSITVKVSWDTDPGVIGSENVTEIKTDLHNDGKSLGSGNFTVTWHGQHPDRRHPWRGTAGPKLHIQLEITAPNIMSLPRVVLTTGQVPQGA